MNMPDVSLTLSEDQCRILRWALASYQRKLATNFHHPNGTIRCLAEMDLELCQSVDHLISDALDYNSR